MVLLPLRALRRRLTHDAGAGGRPPRGWRSWNLYGNNVNQSLITGIMDGMVKKHSYGGSKDTSLCEGFGYCDVGLDDHWQMCGSPDAAPGMHYHDKEGNPIVNLEVFPDLAAMAKHAHSLKLTSGWCESALCLSAAVVQLLLWRK